MTLDMVKYFAIPLPEDVQKMEDAGYFQETAGLIRRYLSGRIPDALRKRLELELVRVAQMEKEYPFSYEQALSMLKKEIPDFSREELDELVKNSEADWSFKEGRPYFVRHFHENLHKVGHPLMKRLIEPEDPQVGQRKQELLNETMWHMKKCGKTAYAIRIRSELKIGEGGWIGAPVTVHIPVPNAGLQVKNIQIHGMSYPGFLSPETFESRTVCFQKKLEEGDAFWIEYSYENHLTYVELDWEKADTHQPEPASASDLEEQAPHILFTPFIRALCHEIIGEEKNPLRKAKLIYDYITDHVRYAYVRRYSTICNIAEYAAANQKGDCGVQAILFITLCRCCGVPARWQSGLFVSPDDIGGHDWAQFYVAPYGWLYADLSFGGSAHRLGNEERRQFYFGNLDPFRMPANSAFQHEFMPPKKYMRNDPTDNQYGECEYEDRALGSSEYQCKHMLLEIKKLW